MKLWMKIADFLIELAFLAACLAGLWWLFT